MNKKAKEKYLSDMERHGNSGGWTKQFHKYFRQAQNCNNKLLGMYYRFKFKRIKEKRGIEIFYKAEIGKGFYMGHAYNITINPQAVLGENVNVHKGVTIGQENRGKRKGVPTIGNCVWIGVNATVVGNITIGDDVLIAPNSYVNCDVPSHSVVFGNPCVIKHNDNATEGYINRTV